MRDITITVNIPALSDLVAYLGAKQQAEVDALTKQVAELSARLNATGTRLDTEVHAHPTRT